MNMKNILLLVEKSLWTERRKYKKNGVAKVLQKVLVDQENLWYHLFSVLEDNTLARGMEHLISHG